MEGWSELEFSGTGERWRKGKEGGRDGRQKGTESDLEVGRACAHLQPCVRTSAALCGLLSVDQLHYAGGLCPPSFHCGLPPRKTMSSIGQVVTLRLSEGRRSGVHSK